MNIASGDSGRRTVSAAMPSHEVVSHGRVGRVARRAMWLTARGIAKVYLRFEVVGHERVPDTGAFVIAPVHRSAIDSPLAAMAFERPVFFMAKGSAFANPWASRALKWFGAFPVSRDGTDFAAIRTFDSLIHDGHPVVVFPEGTRKRGDTLEDLRDGPAFIAARQRVPIVPVGIGGTDRVLPKGSRFLRPRKVVYVIGEPIYPDVELEGRVPRRVISELTEELRDRLDEIYADARSRAG